MTTYFGERDRTGGRLLGDALLDIYAARRLQASILLRGTVGFGRRHHLHTDRLLSLSEDLPVVSVAVDRRDRIEAALEEVLRIKRRGLVTLERARLETEELAAGPRFFSANTNVPMMVTAVGTGERIAAALTASAGLLAQPVVSLERVRVCKRDGERLAIPHELPGVDEHGGGLRLARHDY